MRPPKTATADGRTLNPQKEGRDNETTETIRVGVHTDRLPVRYSNWGRDARPRQPCSRRDFVSSGRVEYPSLLYARPRRGECPSGRDSGPRQLDGRRDCRLVRWANGNPV